MTSCCAPALPPETLSASAAHSTVDQLVRLSMYVDRLSAQGPLAAHPGLRAQMRRSAMDAMSHAACAAEATSLEEYRGLVRRTVSALTELSTFTRMGVARRAINENEALRIESLASLPGCSPASTVLAQPARPQDAARDMGADAGLSGAA